MILGGSLIGWPIFLFCQHLERHFKPLGQHLSVIQCPTFAVNQGFKCPAVNQTRGDLHGLAIGGKLETVFTHVRHLGGQAGVESERVGGETTYTEHRLAALRHGVRRDLSPAKQQRFESARIEMVYYGHHSNDFLRSSGRSYDPAADMLDRETTLDRLKQVPAHEFTRQRYRALPGRSSFKEFLADVGSVVTSPIHLSDSLIATAAPDMAHYWDEETKFGSDVRYEMINPLKRAMRRDGKILVISHSLGTMVAYDTFWKFSHMSEYRHDTVTRPIDTWITLGSPLGDETVKRKLKGASLSGARRYPNIVKRWLNFSAEDDFISHDETIKNDYKDMLRKRLVEEIRDEDIYNLAVRKGSSNPHSSAGYLIHPKLIAAIGDWL